MYLTMNSDEPSLPAEPDGESAGRRTTLRDIADHLGISLTTVSLALRNHPKISQRRRDQIRKVAEEMGYHGNPMAAALVHCRRDARLESRPFTAELAWLNHWADPAALRRFKEFDLCWQGAQRAAEKKGFRLLEFVVDEKMSFARLEQILINRNIQGILIPPHGSSAITAPDAASLDWRRFAVVKLGYSVTGLPAHIVAGNHLRCAKLAFSSIRQRGYRRIGYVCHVRTSSRAKAGFLLAQTTIPLGEQIPILNLDITKGHDPCAAKLEEWLQDYKPDAIITELAELRGILERLGVRIPDQLGLAATSVLDGNADAGIDQHSDEIGRAAVETLIELIYANEMGLPRLCREILVDCSWRDGGSLPVQTESGKPSLAFEPRHL